MSIPNIYSTIYNGVWDLLEGRTTWAALIKPGNRIRWGVKPKPWKDALGDGDMPSAILMQGDGADSTVNIMPTFGTVADPACAARVEDISRELQLILVHQSLALDPANNLILETLAALRNGRAALNTVIKNAVAYGRMKTYGPITYRHDDTGKGISLVPIPIRGETVRATTFFRIPITMTFNTQATALLT